MMRSLTWCCLLFALLASAACGLSLESSRASDKFRAVFGCKAERVYANGSGYRVEGCGVTAYLQCFDDGHRHHDGPLAHTLSQGDNTCMIEHSERRPMPTRAVDPSARVVQRDGERQLRSSVSIPGAQLTLLAAPLRDDERIVVIVKPLRAGTLGCNEAAMWIEGMPVPLEGTREVRNQRGHEVQFAISRDSLKGLSQAVRVVLQTCGEALVLDDAAKKALDSFEIQFREQLSLSPTT